MIAELLQAGPVNQRLAAELMKNMSPEEIWEVLLEMKPDNQNYVYIDINRHRPSYPKDWKTIWVWCGGPYNIILCRDEKYYAPTPEFKKDVIKLLKKAIL